MIKQHLGQNQAATQMESGTVSPRPMSKGEEFSTRDDTQHTTKLRHRGSEMARSTHTYTAWIPGFVAGGLLGVLLLRWQREPSKESSNIDLPPLTAEQKDALSSTAKALATRGKGILAADESTPTVRAAFRVGSGWAGCPHSGAEHTEFHAPRLLPRMRFRTCVCAAHTRVRSGGYCGRGEGRGAIQADAVVRALQNIPVLVVRILVVSRYIVMHDGGMPRGEKINSGGLKRQRSLLGTSPAGYVVDF